MVNHHPAALLRNTWKVLDILDFQIRKAGDELDLEVSERAYLLPLAALVWKVFHLQDVEIGKVFDHAHGEVGKAIDRAKSAVQGNCSLADFHAAAAGVPACLFGMQ